MSTSAFTLIEKRELSEVGGTISLFEHTSTKAQLLSVVNGDENKCFGVTLRTPPADSTGVAHIMEHSVLCGSQKYPVKEPFVELLKGSLQTFLNAFTFPDKTCYPVASANLQDFYNLIDVYLDAVFHPSISEDIFRQEGWHIDAQSKDGPWTYKGVVFNEMKGAYSSPVSVLAEQSQQSLFPDTLYSLDSGGDPERIPDLTYQSFRDFHARYYHPSNARFFFWGDDPESKRLEIVQKVLADYEYKKVDSVIPLQHPFALPRQREVAYAAGDGQDKAMFTVNWLLGERGNVHEALQMEMLSHILEGMPGSPLQRALITSGLGEDTTGCGLETDLRQMYYSTGLKGIRREDIPRAETLIFDTLQELVDKGIASSTVLAAVNSVEFDYRERNTGRFPRGIAAMIQALSTWLYDGDPFAALAFEAPLADIKERLARGEKLFEELITTRFLKNQHRSTVILVPDPLLADKLARNEAERLESFQKSQDESGRKYYLTETERLAKAQTTPDSPEALATIPALTVADLPKRNALIPQKAEQGDYLFLAHEQPTVGIAYATLLLPLWRVPDRLIPLFPLFLRTITEIGTDKHDYITLGDTIAANTGGVSGGVTVGTTFGSKRFFGYFALGGKAVYEKLEDMFALFEELLLHPLRDRQVATERIGQILLEMRAGMEQYLQSAGHSAVTTRLAARYSPQGAWAERTGGITYFASLKNILNSFATSPDSLLDDLECLRKAILGDKEIIFSCTAEDAALGKVKHLASSLIAQLPSAEGTHTAQYSLCEDLPHAEALIMPSRVNYVGKSVNLGKCGWTYHGSASVILRYLKMGYLWENVRVMGGAYGAFCSLDRCHGTLICASYRDPNTQKTLEAFDKMAHYLAHFTPSATQLTQAIVGAVGDLDCYRLPSARGAVALARRLSGDSDEQRQQMREEMLSTEPRHFREFADVLAQLKDGSSCLLGGDDARTFALANGFDVVNVLAEDKVEA